MKAKGKGKCKGKWGPEGPYGGYGGWNKCGPMLMWGGGRFGKGKGKW